MVGESPRNYRSDCSLRRQRHQWIGVRHRHCRPPQKPGEWLTHHWCHGQWPGRYLPECTPKNGSGNAPTGGLLTESQPGTKPDAHLFPARNRIIAGLSDVVVVVEAAAKGGALITAEYANNYHREVFAVPGQLNQAFSAGCNKLIRENKAQIYTSPTDIIEALNWDHPRNEQPTPALPPPLPVDITEDESQILALLRQTADLHIDELSWKSQIPMGRLASLLLTLEFRGFVRSLPGKKYAVIYV